jgi:hypothetical protein
MNAWECWKPSLTRCPCRRLTTDSQLGRDTIFHMWCPYTYFCAETFDINIDDDDDENPFIIMMISQRQGNEPRGCWSFLLGPRTNRSCTCTQDNRPCRVACERLKEGLTKKYFGEGNYDRCVLFGKRTHAESLAEYVFYVDHPSLLALYIFCTVRCLKMAMVPNRPPGP